MRMQILGMGCPKCRTLEANARTAIEQLGIEADVVKVADSDAIAEMGVMMTPALAIDDTVEASGKVLSVEEIVDIVRRRSS